MRLPLILWCDGGHDAAENMRRDTALLASLDAAPSDERRAVLRLFRFDPHGITLGHGQSPARELDLDRCAADGVGWAVRPTGGRAIFHAQEWTFSLAAAIDDPDWGGPLREAYAAASRLICASLVRLGVPAELQSRRASPRHHVTPPDAPWPHDSALVAKEGASSACFAATARHEIVLGGRKLVGSAQRRTATALLQQGSVLLGDGHLRLADYLAFPGDERRRVRETLAASATHAGATLGPMPPLARWADAIAGELGEHAQRFDGDDGAFLLTLAKARSYTSPVSEPSSRPGIAGGTSHV